VRSTGSGAESTSGVSSISANCGAGGSKRSVRDREACQGRHKAAAWSSRERLRVQTRSEGGCRRWAIPAPRDLRLRRLPSLTPRSSPTFHPLVRVADFLPSWGVPVLIGVQEQGLYLWARRIRWRRRRIRASAAQIIPILVINRPPLRTTW